MCGHFDRSSGKTHFPTDNQQSTNKSQFLQQRIPDCFEEIWMFLPTVLGPGTLKIWQNIAIVNYGSEITLTVGYV